MRKIISIAKTELFTLFFSPIAWIILIIFCFQSYYTFAEALDSLVNNYTYGGSLYNVTTDLFIAWDGVFTIMKEKIYLFIHLLTMGIMSREYNLGYIKLLYSSPVSSISIVVGKYISIVCFVLIMMLSLLPIMIATAMYVEFADFSLIMSGCLGLILLMCAYGAIGFFMSTLTSYQIVAAMMTLGSLAFLSNIGELAQDVLFLRDITYWLSLTGRVDTLIKGLISSSDTFYFIIVIVLFCLLSVLKIQSSKIKHNTFVLLTRYLFVFIGAILLGYFSSRPRFVLYYDATSTQENTISKQSQEYIQSIEGELDITSYVNMADNNAWMGVPRMINQDLSWFKQYQRFKPDMNLTYVYYYDEPLQTPGYGKRTISAEDEARDNCKYYNMNFDDLLTPKEIRAQIDLFPEENSFVRLVKDNQGRTCFFRMFNDMSRYPSEKEAIGALKRMVSKPPMIRFLCGHGEPSIYGVGEKEIASLITRISKRESLVNQGYDIDTLNLSTFVGNKISDNTDILAIVDPKKILSDKENKYIKQYLKDGNNMLIALEAGRENHLKEICDFLGIETYPGVLVHSPQSHSLDFIASHFTYHAYDLSEAFYAVWGGVLTTPSVLGLDYKLSSEFEIIPLTSSVANGVWNEIETSDFVNDTPILNEKIGEVSREMVTSFALVRRINGKEQRIIVLGDSDCLTHSELNRGRNGISKMNSPFVEASFSWLSNDRLPIDTSKGIAKDNSVSLTIDDLPLVRTIIVWLCPIILALLGTLICVRRSRR